MTVGENGKRWMHIRRRWTTLATVAALMGLLAGSAGCEAESGLDELQCGDDEECPEGSACEDGFCVDVPDPQQVMLYPGEPTTIEKEQSMTVEATVYDENGDPYEDDVDLEWSVVGDESLIELSGSDEGNDVTVTGGEPGTALLQVQVRGLDRSLPITVSETAVTDVVLSPQEGVIEDEEGQPWTIEEGATGQLQAQALGTQGGDEVVLTDRLIQWKSSDPQVLTVDSDGALYAERTSSQPVTITATAGANDVSTFQDIEVRDRSADQVTIIPGDFQMAAGDEVRVTAEAFHDGDRLDRTIDEFEWSLDGPDELSKEVGEQGVTVAADADLGADLRIATLEASLDDTTDDIEIRAVDELDDGINISPSELELSEQQTARLSATVIDDGVIVSDVNLDWEIDDSDVLEFVDGSEGDEVDIRAVGPGTATVTADDDDLDFAEDEIGEATVDVEEAPFIAIDADPSTVTLTLGDDEEQNVEISLTTLAQDILDAVAIDADSDIDPTDIDFDVDNSAVATVNQNTSATATVFAGNNPGTTTLTITFDDYDLETDIGINVSAQPVQGVTIDEDSPIELSMSDDEDEATLTASVTPDLDLYNDFITWWSSDEGTVDFVGSSSQGESVTIEAVGDGEATITAFVGGQSASVVAQVERDFQITGSDNSVDVADTLDLEAELDEQSVDANWGSDDPSVATVDQNGVVTGKYVDDEKEEVDITASYEGFTASKTINVTNPFELTAERQESGDLAIGEQQKLEAVLDNSSAQDPEDECFDGEFSWTSSNPDIVGVDGQGGEVAVYGVEPGSTDITVHCGPLSSAPVSITVSSPTIDITSAPGAVALGDSGVVEATIEGGGGCQPSWSSSDWDSLSVESDGSSTATVHGQAEATDVTVSVECKGESATANVDVTNPHDIQVTSSDPQLEVGDTQELFDLDGCPPEFLTLTSSDSTVATVDSDGRVSAVGTGDANISAQCGDDAASETVEVFALTDVTINPGSLELDAGESDDDVEAQLTYDGPSGSSFDDKCDPDWSSDDPDVATVDDSSSPPRQATVEATSEPDEQIEETVIHVHCDGRHDSITVTVEYQGEEIEIVSPDDEEDHWLERNTSEVFEAEINGGDAQANCEVELQWTSSDPSIAIVDSDGLVTALGDHGDETNIEVACGNETDSFEVEVISEPDQIEIECKDNCQDGDPHDFDVDGDEGVLEMSAEYDGTELEECTATWISDNDDVEVDDGEFSWDGTGNPGAGDEANVTAACGGESETVFVNVEHNL